MGLAYTNSATLSEATTWDYVDQHHQMVVRFHAGRNDLRAKNIDAVDGVHYTPEELHRYQETFRVPVVFNQFPSSRRTVVGTFLRERFDVEVVPVGAEDQKLADALRALFAHEDYQGNDTHQDAIMAVNAWIGGDANRYCWPETWPGERPYIANRILNPFAVSWDPNSVELILRTDAEFVDIDLWMSGDEIAERWPDAALNPDVVVENSTGEFLPVDNARDRDHESMGHRNGKWHVVERYYRRREVVPCILDGNNEWIAIKDVGRFSKMFPTQKIVRRRSESLWVCQWAPEAQKDKKFLYNGPYHVQPRDPKSGRILWPVVELVAEQINGVAKSFVTPLQPANKVIDVMVTGIIESAKHAPSSYEVDESAFISPSEAHEAIKYGPHSNRRWRMKPGMAGKGFAPSQKSQVSGDFASGINLASQYIDQQSSTPPATRGLAEGNASGTLNQQRIEQGNTQLAEFINNFRLYRKTLANLRYAYAREIYTDEMLVRVEGLDGKIQSYTLNQEVQGTDPHGFPIPGSVVKINDITSALFDIRMVDSFKSPTVRDRQLQVLGQLMQNQAVMADPDMSRALITEFARLSDSSAEFKAAIAQAGAARAAAAQEKQRLDTLAQMQSVADDEAAAMSPSNKFPTGNGGVPALQPQPAGEPSNQELESVP